MLMFLGHSLDGSASLKVSKSGIPLNLNIGIVMTLSILLMTGATNGEFPYWTLGSILSFLPLPEVISNMTVFHLIAISALYK
jgi:hypothetical protein